MDRDRPFSTVCGHRLAHRKWKETKQQPIMLPGPAVPGCCLVSFHFLWAILRPHPVLSQPLCRRYVGRLVTDGEIEMGLEDRNRSSFLSFSIIPATIETPLKEDVARDFPSIYLPSQKRCYS